MNSGDPDQTSFSAVSDLDLHCLPMSHKKEARLIWVNPPVSFHIIDNKVVNCVSVF